MAQLLFTQLYRLNFEKDSKEFSVLYMTSDNKKDIECLHISEVDKNAMTIKEYIEKMKKK